jgi:hypothetical protein
VMAAHSLIRSFVCSYLTLSVTVSGSHGFK